MTLDSQADLRESGSADALLRVEDARCAIPTGRGDVKALGGVDLELRAGEVLGVVGESGSGKSTLAGFIIGALAPGAQSTGSVILEGQDLRSLPSETARRVRGRRIGIVFQDPMMALNPVVPIGRQVTEAAMFNLGLSRAEAKAKAVGLLRQVGIPDPERRLRHYPHQFSGGMRQRITIAMALVCDPDILIADEPTTALDVTVQRQILDLLARLARERSLAMIMVSHDLSVIAGRTDTIAVMYGGYVVESGPTVEVFRNPRHPYTRALLRAIPRIDGSRHARLEAIPGSPPDLTLLGTGCPFAPRCPNALPLCADVMPAVSHPHGGRTLRCHNPVPEGA
ncbi:MULTISPECIES: ABC transporter ATP-binding protein [Microbacterium]|uniref:ABC transporter ATP-binding protein n=1 Tax=Microbacterium wangchenii TaxID=2541726 RepID=A0ABX5SNV2_9MICO|nr:MULTISPECIES: ABC transporter ATP-binding protein [Microbacterium]MCK6068052.1 ABC transporter ATP-binding protein [Microbacterium sp. EYE_512]QBR87818.1 ABC transporter ATP-binding protein [Microbacterium wangchenii]TFV84060.1 ABC transporter ATP-binding protein [Microbacterium sp. dk485]TXK16111.1 ABC transporter ATP-binding protein [Microbacterium wangchenii]